MLYSEENSKIDKDSLELCYFFVPDYKVFHNFGVSLHPKYAINLSKYDFDTDEFELEIIEKDSYFDLFENEQINLKILCGRNGCGKSTLLKLIGGYENPAENKWILNDNEYIKTNKSTAKKRFPKLDKRYECLYVYKDKNGNFIATKQIKIIHNNQEKRLGRENECSITPRDLCAIDSYVDNFFINKNILKNYLKYTKLFEGILPEEEVLFNKFQIRLWNFDENFKNIRLSPGYKIFVNEYEEEVEESLYSNWFLFYFLTVLFYIKDISFIQSIEREISQSTSLFPDAFELLENRVSCGYENLYDEIKNKINYLQQKVYDITDYTEAEKDVKDLGNKMQILIRNALGDRKQGVYPTFSSAYIYYSAYYEKNGLKRYFEDLSEGEQRQFVNRYQIYNLLKKKDAIFWYIDEVDKDLHPEWSRTFIYDYLQSYKDVKNILSKETHGKFNTDKRITLLFTTHSPFVLSDVTSDYIIYLEKDEETGKTTEKFIDKNTFAGNIGEMFSANFFMNETIGKFAKEYLKSIIKELDSDEKLFEHKIEEIKKVISAIGDDILRLLLKEKLERKIEADKAKF